MPEQITHIIPPEIGASILESISNNNNNPECNNEFALDNSQSIKDPDPNQIGQSVIGTFTPMHISPLKNGMIQVHSEKREV